VAASPLHSGNSPKKFVNVSGNGAGTLPEQLYKALIEVLFNPSQKVSGEGCLIPSSTVKHLTMPHSSTKNCSIRSRFLGTFSQHPLPVILCDSEKTDIVHDHPDERRKFCN